MKNYADNFAYDNLPNLDLQPDYVFLDLPQFQRSEMLNCVDRLLDQHIREGRGDTICIRTFETTWTSGMYRLEPLNTVLQGRPYTRVVTTGIRTLPLFTYPPMPSFQITATWGWPAIPDDIREAAILLSMRMFSRYNAPLGVAGFGDMGAITVRAIDPDVRDLLSPYVIIGFA